MNESIPENMIKSAEISASAWEVKNMTRDQCADYIRTHRTVKTKAAARKLKAVDRKLNRLSCDD